MGCKSWMRVWVATLAVGLSAVSAASGQQWATDMFNHRSHDFGTVARGAKVEHRFPVENIYLEDAHIASARVSCGCTSPEVPTRILKTWDKADVITRVDTAAFLGQKDVTITVVFDRPFYAEVQLQIHCYIRSDVVVQPGLVQFGAVAQGTASQQKVTISYAGRSDWQIQGVESANPSLTAQAVEVARGGGLVTYDLYVSLAANAPPGYIRDQLYLVTNDLNPRSIRVPVPVEGVVQSALTVHPSPLYMGTVEPGKSITRQLVVSGNTQFRVLGVESTNAQFQCTPPAAAGVLQRIPVVFAAGNQPGKIVGRIRIQTDSGATPLEVPVDVDVIASAPAEQSPPAKPPETVKRSKPSDPPGTPAGREL